MPPMRLFVGTSGFAYKEWKGPFYPDKLPDADMLAFYAERLRTVEINNTFYRMPSAQMLERWASQVPEEFQFVLKASRRITHRSRIRAESAKDSLGPGPNRRFARFAAWKRTGFFAPPSPAHTSPSGGREVCAFPSAVSGEAFFGPAQCRLGCLQRVWSLHTDDQRLRCRGECTAGRAPGGAR